LEKYSLRGGRMKLPIFIALLFLINACSETPEVLMIKGGKLGSCPSKTVEEMVDGFMGSPSWSSITGDDGSNYVNIIGDITFNEKPVRALIQYKLNEDETFEFNALEFNDIPQNGLIAMGLQAKMCE
jgi:hypothetical protein